MSIVLREVRSDSYCTIYAMGNENDCELLSFLREMQKDNPDEVEKLTALLDHTVKHGPPKNEKKCRWFPKEDLFEFKTPGGIRVMAFWDKGYTIICSHGFLKKKQKTPRNELKKAEKAKKYFFDAKENGEVVHHSGGRYE